MKPYLNLLAAPLLTAAFVTHGAIYKESGGIVVVEAEHFDKRTTNSVDLHHWAIMPDENGNPDTAADPGFTGARGGQYMQSLPDSTGGGISHTGSADQVGIDPYLEYKVQISTPGDYRLWLRWGGYDGSSDSMYGQIVEMETPAGPGPDFYRYAYDNNGTFGVWNGSGAPSTDTANAFSAGGGEVPAVWPLTAGTYTIRLSMREDGSAVDAVMLQLASLPDPADPGPAESAIVGSFITIGQQPQDVIVATGQTPTFSVTATGSSALTYQWQKAAPGSTNFTDIPGATQANYTAGATALADSGTRYRAAVSIPGNTITSREALVTVDIIPPVAYRAIGSPRFDRVTIVFSEAVGAATGTNLANYAITGLTVSNATLSAGGTNVVLATSPQTTGTVYTVTVKNVGDKVTPPNILSPNPTTLKFTGWTLGKGGVLQKFWENVTPNNIAALTSDPRYPDHPTSYTIEPAFEYPPNGGNEAGDNYGNQLSGWLVAPTTGNYVFFVCSDDPSELYLSTDDNPANLHLIAQETQWSDPRQWVSSAGNSDLTAKRSDQLGSTEWPGGNTITLTAGKRYYIQALHTEGGGGDNVGVTWQLPGAAEPVDGDLPIQATNVFTYLNPDVSTATVKINSPTNGATLAAGANITIVAQAEDTNGPLRKVDFFAGTTLLGSLTNGPYSVTWNNVVEGRYTLTVRVLDRLGYIVQSAPVAITVGNLNETFQQDSTGMVVMEAENYHTNTVAPDGHTWVFGSSVPGYSGTGHLQALPDSGANQNTYPDLLTQSPRLDYKVNFVKTGTNYIWIRGVDPLGTSGGAGDSVNAGIDGDNPPTALRIDGTPSFDTATWSWVGRIQGDARATIVVPKTGDHVVNVWMREDGFFFDKIIVTSDVNFTPSGIGPAESARVGQAPPATQAKFGQPIIQGTNLILNWTGGGTLQSAAAVTGPWKDVANANSPYAVPLASGASAFYRVKQ